MAYQLKYKMKGKLGARTEENKVWVHICIVEFEPSVMIAN